MGRSPKPVKGSARGQGFAVPYTGPRDGRREET